jgi:HAD superfamily hydrolase (TIGR01457 family)
LGRYLSCIIHAGQQGVILTFSLTLLNVKNSRKPIYAPPANIKSLILDMDGVLWKADTPIGNLPEIFTQIHNRDLKVLFATNNGSMTPHQYVERFSKYGVQVTENQIVTSALSVAYMLQQIIPHGGPVFAIGELGVMNALREKGFEPLSVDNAEKALAVVVGIDRQITYDKVCEATLLVRRGLPFYATNPDKTFPTPRGEIPGAGAWISVITTATGIEPVYAGKPYTYLGELALARLGTRKEETLVVGDRLETDIAAGQALGCPCALVLSGVSTRSQAEAWVPKIDFITSNLASLVD